MSRVLEYVDKLRKAKFAGEFNKIGWDQKWIADDIERRFKEDLAELDEVFRRQLNEHTT